MEMTPTDEQVERVARALWKAHFEYYKLEPRPFESQPTSGQELWRFAARAAIAALPPRELLREALDALTPFAAQSRASGPTEERNIRRARAAADKIRAALAGDAG